MTKQEVDKFKDNITMSWDSLQEVSKVENQEELIEDVRGAVQQMQNGTFRLVVMGEIKKGKSSFINALLGIKDILPTASDIATSTVYQIMYGEKQQIRVFFKQDFDTNIIPPPLNIAENQIADYGTEDGNPNNTKNVDYIAVELPNKLLESGLVIVDTPGVGGLFKAHKDITWKYAPNADAIFFILDSVEAVISRDEIKFLEDLTSKMTKRVYFVQTKIDIPGEEQWIAWEMRNKEIIIENLPWTDDDIKYFPVSSTLKQKGDKKNKERFIKDSGFPAVLEFLEDELIASKDMILAKEVSTVMQRHFKALEQGVSSRLKVAQINNKDTLIKMENEYREVLKKMQQWEQETYKEEVQNFSYKLQDIRQDLNDSLQNELNINSPIVTNLIDNIKHNDDIQAEELNDAAGRIQKEVIDQSTEIIIKIQTEFNEQVTNLVTTTTEILSDSLGSDEIVPVSLKNAHIANSFNVQIQNSLDMQFSGFEAARNSLYGGMAGSMMAGGAIGLASIIFPPLAAVTMIASIGGLLFGSYQGNELAKVKQKEQAVAKLQNQLSKTISKIQQQGVQQFRKLATDSERNSKRLFEKALKVAKNKIITQQKDLQSAQKDTKEVLEKKVAEANAILAKINKASGLIRRG